MATFWTPSLWGFNARVTSHNPDKGQGEDNREYE